MEKISGVLSWLLLFGAGVLFASDNRPIGVFDSGTGGLTVLEKMLTDEFAHEKFVYLGDQANMPYGDYAAAGKSDFLRGLVIRDAEFLLGKNAKVIVIACNTATAYGYDAVAQLLAKRGDGTRVIGVVNAGARSAIRQLDLVRHPQPCAIGVLATPGTIASGVYERTIKSELKKLGVTCGVQVFSRGCAGLADAVEAGSANAPEIACDNLKALMAEHRAKAPHLPLKAVILGCTHFPFVQRELQAAAPKDVIFVDPAVDTAAECAAALEEQDRRTDAETPMSVETYVSVAAPGLDPSKLDEKGGLTRAWKYGRTDAAADRSTVPVPIAVATKGDPLKFIPFAHMIPRVRGFLRNDFLRNDFPKNDFVGEMRDRLAREVRATFDSCQRERDFFLRHDSPELSAAAKEWRDLRRSEESARLERLLKRIGESFDARIGPERGGVPEIRGGSPEGGHPHGRDDVRLERLRLEHEMMERRHRMMMSEHVQRMLREEVRDFERWMRSRADEDRRHPFPRAAAPSRPQARTVPDSRSTLRDRRKRSAGVAVTRERGRGRWGQFVDNAWYWVFSNGWLFQLSMALLVALAVFRFCRSCIWLVRLVRRQNDFYRRYEAGIVNRPLGSDVCWFCGERRTGSLDGSFAEYDIGVCDDCRALIRAFPWARLAHYRLGCRRNLAYELQAAKIEIARRAERKRREEEAQREELERSYQTERKQWVDRLLRGDDLNDDEFACAFEALEETVEKEPDNLAAKKLYDEFSQAAAE